VDLLARAGELLAGVPVRTLDVRAASGADGTLQVDVEATQVDRADVYVDGRPRASLDVDGQSAAVTLSGCAGAAVVRVAAFAGGELVASRSLRL
jgi:hypothetical protein